MNREQQWRRAGCRAVVWLLVCGLVGSGVLWAEDLVCSVCHRRITGHFLRGADGTTFCSQSCFEKTLPKCVGCGKTLTGQFLVKDGKKYCAACYEKTLPACELCGRHVQAYQKFGNHVFCNQCANRPHCAECRLPVAKGRQLGDGRVMCETCYEAGVFSAEAAAKYYTDAQKAIYEITDIVIKDPPEVQVVSINELAKLWKTALSPESTIRGFYQRTVRESQVVGADGRPVTVQKTVETHIYLLSGQGPGGLVATACHELTHHLQASVFPQLDDAPRWVVEGMAQYVSATYCRKHQLTRQLAAIEDSPLPDYGDGYRYFKRLLGADNWPAMRRWLRDTDIAKLPAQAPPTP